MVLDYLPSCCRYLSGSRNYYDIQSTLVDNCVPLPIHLLKRSANGLGYVELLPAVTGSPSSHPCSTFNNRIWCQQSSNNSFWLVLGICFVCLRTSSFRKNNHVFSIVWTSRERFADALVFSKIHSTLNAKACHSSSLDII